MSSSGEFIKEAEIMADNIKKIIEQAKTEIKLAIDDFNSKTGNK